MDYLYYEAKEPFGPADECLLVVFDVMLDENNNRPYLKIYDFPLPLSHRDPAYYYGTISSKELEWHWRHISEPPKHECQSHQYYCKGDKCCCAATHLSNQNSSSKMEL